MWEYWSKNEKLFLKHDASNAGFKWWGPGAQAWWDAPCADIKSLGRGWPMKPPVFPPIINVYDVG